MNQIMFTKELQFIKEKRYVPKRARDTVKELRRCLIWKPRELHIALRNLIENES